MKKRAILRKLRSLEKAFAVTEEHNPEFIIEMWQPHQDDSEKIEEMIEKAAREIREGEKEFVLVPLGAGEKLRERDLIP